MVTYMWADEGKRLFLRTIRDRLIKSKPYPVLFDKEMKSVCISLQEKYSIKKYSKGIYAIYASPVRLAQLKKHLDTPYAALDNCLYVGESNYDVYQRVMKFFNEINNTRHYSDFPHYGGEKAFRFGYDNTWSYYIKYISYSHLRNLEQELKVDCDWMYLDEYLAPMLDSGFNSKTLTFEWEGSTLEAFFPIEQNSLDNTTPRKG